MDMFLYMHALIYTSYNPLICHNIDMLDISTES